MADIEKLMFKTSETVIFKRNVLRISKYTRMSEKVKIIQNQHNLSLPNLVECKLDEIANKWLQWRWPNLFMLLFYFMNKLKFRKWKYNIVLSQENYKKRSMYW